MADEKDKASKDADKNTPEKEGMKAADIVKSQANYTGSEHSDLVQVTIIKDDKYYRKGDKDIVHPSLAQILKAKGLIEGDGEPYKRPEFKQSDITVDA